MWYHKVIMGAFTFVGDKWIICLTAKKFPDAEKDFSPKERSDIMNEVEDLVKKFEGKLSMRVTSGKRDYIKIELRGDTVELYGDVSDHFRANGWDFQEGYRPESV